MRPDEPRVWYFSERTDEKTRGCETFYLIIINSHTWHYKILAAVKLAFRLWAATTSLNRYFLIFKLLGLKSTHFKREIFMSYYNYYTTRSNVSVCLHVITYHQLAGEFLAQTRKIIVRES